MPTQHQPHTTKYEYWKSSHDNQWYWRYVAGNGETIAAGEGYRRKEDCLRAVYLLKDSTKAPIIDLETPSAP